MMRYNMTVAEFKTLYGEKLSSHCAYADEACAVIEEFEGALDALLVKREQAVREVITASKELISHCGLVMDGKPQNPITKFVEAITRYDKTAAIRASGKE